MNTCVVDFIATHIIGLGPRPMMCVAMKSTTKKFGIPRWDGGDAGVSHGIVLPCLVKDG